MTGRTDDEFRAAPRLIITRRQFLKAMGAGAAALGTVTILGDCGVSRSLTPADSLTGTISGSVVDLAGAPQAVGRIYLLEDSGLNDGQYADVDASGKFDLGSVPAGPYQVRFWGGNLADVPETFPNPVRVTVTPQRATVVQFHIQLGGPGATDREIYAGDFFYQEQPYGLPNATVVVPLGTGVCWYNVGKHTHTVTGGPWGDSGDILPLGNFMWTADQVGTFPYRCTYHSPDMLAVLQVVPA